MHGLDGGVNLRVRQGGEPPDAAIYDFSNVQPESLHQHHVSELLGDQQTSRPRLAEFLHHSIQRPAHGRLVRLFLQVNDRWQCTQQHLGVAPAEGKVAARDEAVSAAVDGVDCALTLAGDEGHGVDGR